MAIEAKKNNNYGGVLVSQKYSPLEDIKYKRPQSAEYSALLTNRLTQLTNANILPQPLRLITDWDTALAAVTGHDPPLVVISSNRSKWIAEGVRLSREQWTLTKYDGSNDLKALTGGVSKQAQSPPLYLPLRMDGDRKVFIVVHAHEYRQYRKALADSDMTVVGWSFNAPPTAPGQLTGFGASRYAAIEFCKHLRANMAGVKWDYAWLFDDNVVGITAFPGYAAVEAAMAAATTPQVCSAFQGSSSVEGFSDIKKWATGEVNATPTRGKPTVLPAPTTPRGIIQQVALWNIKYMTEQRLNFSPLFVTSGEDISIGNYFNINIPAQTPLPARPRVPYLYYSGMRVRKEVVAYHDDGEAAGLVNTAKQAFAKWFADQEATATPAVGVAPPPVQLEIDGGSQTLVDLITTWFSDGDEAKRPPGVAATDTAARDKAKCQAVEQIASGAIGSECVSTAALNRTFIFQDVAGQAIQRFPPPRP